MACIKYLPFESTQSHNWTNDCASQGSLSQVSKLSKLQEGANKFQICGVRGGVITQMKKSDFQVNSATKYDWRILPGPIGRCADHTEEQRDSANCG
jgi:hypothetical protein